jgi:hypothetical protein
VCVRSLRTQQCVIVLFVGVCADSFGECVNSLGFLHRVFVGEFDPGSGRTLAACLIHASRTGSLLSGGGLVANG